MEKVSLWYRAVRCAGAAWKYVSVGQYIGTSGRYANADIKVNTHVQAAVKYTGSVDPTQATANIYDSCFHILVLHRA